MIAALRIPLCGKKGKGKFAIIDADDYNKVSSTKWFDVNGYARSRDGKSMHRLIMSPPEDKEIDHMNHNRLDNRKKNLRICTRQENARNVPHKGYYYDKTHEYWVVRRGTKSRIYSSENEAIAASKLWDSGVELEKRGHGNDSRYRPKYISRNRLASYRFRCVRDGIVYSKYGFSAIAEAIEYRDNFFAARGESI